MGSPIAPSIFQGVIPTASGDVCDKFQKAFKVFPQSFASWYSYVYNEDGSFTDNFKADICGIDCASLPVTGGPTPGASLATPTLQFNAVTNTSIVLTWTAIPGATYYELVRNTANCLFGATFVGYTVNTSIADTTVAGGTFYYYWLRAANPTNSSAFSSMRLAFTSTGSTLPIPAGTTTATNGTIAESVRVSWTHTQGSDNFDVYRNTSNTLSGATLLGNTPYLFWADYTAVPGTAYYYIVVNKNVFNYQTNNTGVLGQR